MYFTYKSTVWWTLVNCKVVKNKCERSFCFANWEINSFYWKLHFLKECCNKVLTILNVVLKALNRLSTKSLKYWEISKFYKFNRSTGKRVSISQLSKCHIFQFVYRRDSSPISESIVSLFTQKRNSHSKHIQDPPVINFIANLCNIIFNSPF